MSVLVKGDNIIIDDIVYYPITDEAAKNVMDKWYYISEYGVIYSIYNRNFVSINNAGEYFSVGLKIKNGSYQNFLLHRILMITFKFVPNYENLQVNHINGIKKDNRLENMEWVTLAENNKHARLNNLALTGDRCSWRVLNESQVRDICIKVIKNPKITITELAKEYNVHQNVIRDILVGNTWKEISVEYNFTYDQRAFFSIKDVHFICNMFEQHKGKSFMYIYYLIIYFMQLPEDPKIRKRIYRIYTKDTFTDISSQYNF